MTWPRRFGVPVVIALLVLAAYAYCLPPGPSWQDAGEAQVIPYIGGLFHSPGFPTYVILGWLWSHAFVVGNVAWRMSLMSAVAVAVSAALVAVTARHLGASRAASALSAIVYASAPIVLTWGTRAGVNSIQAVLVASAVTLAVFRRPVAASIFAALAVGAHLISLWMLPGLAVLILPGIGWRRAAVAAASFAATLAAVIAYIPLRAATAPDAFWNLYHDETWLGLMHMLTGADWGAGGYAANVLSAHSLEAACGMLAVTLAAQYGAASALAALGLWSRYGVGLAMVAFGALPFAVTYPSEGAPGKYALVLIWVAALAIACGLRRLPVVATAVLVVTLGANCAHLGTFIAQRQDGAAAALIQRLQAETPSNALIIGAWYYAEPVVYAAEVERTMNERIILTAEHVTSDEAAAFAARYHRPIYVLPLSAYPVPPSFVPVVGSEPALYEALP